MNDRCDPETTAIEQRLHGRTPRIPPPALRSRVLAAVDQKVTATKSGKDAQALVQDYPDLVAVTFLASAAVAVALSLLMALILPQLAVDARHLQAVPRPLPSFVERARAADVEFPIAPPHVGQLAVGSPVTHPDDRSTPFLRLIDSRRLLEGEL